MTDAEVNRCASKLIEEVARQVECERELLGPVFELWFQSCGLFNGQAEVRDLRNVTGAIVTAAEYGMISSDVADTLADSFGCGPLTHGGDTVEHDPAGKSFWSLPMAAAWIATRDMQAVMSCDDAYLADCLSWRYIGPRYMPKGGDPRGFHVPSGHVLRPPRRASLKRFDLGDCPEGFDPERAARSIKSLWDKLANGELIATGQMNGDRRAIDAALWQDLNTQFESAGSDVEVLVARDPMRPRPVPERQWHDVTVKSQNVLKIWPKPTAESESRVDPFRSGGPGKPTAIHLVFEEFKRRREIGQTQLILKNEAAALHDWLTENYPTAPPTTAKSIANKIRNDHRSLRLSMPQKPQ
jgi:hypothetical protein